MAEENRKPADTGQSAKPDQLDRMLDAALARYAAVEPRVGLDERILANLRAQGATVTRPAWWRWSLAGAAAIAVLVAVIAWRSKPVSRPSIAHHPSIAAPGKPDSGPQVSMNGTTNQEQLPVRRPLRPGRRPPHPTAVASSPKLDVFPSSRPPSEQEQILVAYVMQFHRQAILLAQITNEELQRDRMEVFGNSEGTTSIEQSAEKETTNR